MAATKEILNFLTGVRGYGNNNEKKKKIFDWAFSNAFGDMWTHTAEYIVKDYFKEDNIICRYNKKAVREAIKQYIRDDYKVVKDQDENTFSKWHKDVCDKIVDMGDKLTVVLIDNTQNNKDVLRKSKKENKDVQKEPEYEYVQAILVKRPCAIKAKELTISQIICHAKKEEMKVKGRPITTPFSYGHAQKLVNMMLKYLYIYCNCYDIVDLNTVAQWFHVPMDSYVLDKSVKLDDKGFDTPWSQINSYGEYEEIKVKIENAAKKHYSNYQTAFEWELAEWPFSDRG